MKMNFESKLSRYFSNINIKLLTKPARHIKHQYSDYIEVISLFSSDNFLSTSDILDRFKDEGIIVKKDSNINQEDNDADRAEDNDIDEVFINQIFGIIIDRVSLYKDDYPFEIYDNNKIKRKQNLTQKHKIYLFLLISSNLSLFSMFQPELTSDFEMVSFQALKNFLPAHAVVKSFGKNSEYTGIAKDKITQLAGEMNLEIDYSSLNQISDEGVQERGLDLVGWIPFDDNNPNTLSFFCQCACGKEWYKKLTESRRYENYYRFYRNKPIHTFFIPYSLIDYQKSCFYQSDEITVETLVFERKRILNYIVDEAFFEACNSKLVVDKCISTEEDIV